MQHRLLDSLLLVLSLWTKNCTAFQLLKRNRGCFSRHSSNHCSGTVPFQQHKRFLDQTLFLQKGWFVPDDEKEDEDELITREKFQRAMMEDPKVKRKRKKGQGYKSLDNRDHLPFAVKKITPDPYTHPEVKNAKRKKAKTKKTDLDHQMTASRLYQNEDGKDTATLLGEFKLDKSTTSGDIIVINEREFRVEKARCQYKYAGGSRFVMVRKILEVKELNRVHKEEFLTQQLKRSESETPPMLE